ncbi:AraC family transcriptional regulator [Winogradskyella sp.]|jgi:AraC-like DNA-binding protein|uniref:helix-turn-helix domain-containing protein n=1 Tax=Winogradskyella sp. TaxID=1883156 RepID=UPI0025D8CF74|nr:helix-turn-helix domain-containing protein [Winogradskyella sp.]MCT4629893.1 helix-turn-helix domain-containing protein [Winogradskyella sp.]
MKEIIHIKSITEACKAFGLPSSKHPLVNVVWAKNMPSFNQYIGIKYNTDFFSISLKDGMEGSMGYGRNSYDFTDGTMVFTKPNQVLSIEEKNIQDDAKGWMLAFHPDLIRRSDLGKTISQYNFFDYEVHEALHLSEDEKATLTDLVRKIETEINQNIDKHSQKLIVSTIELILDYCNRYYDRQFYVRTNLHQDHVSEFENFLKSYFNSEKPSEIGLPSVKYCGEQLNMSPNYLSDLLKKETGKSAKDHIYAFVVNKAKNKLLGTTASISEIAYDLGFDYPQHFSKLFKKQTGMSPAKYRVQN